MKKDDPTQLMIDDLLNFEEGLTEWGVQFLESIKSWYENRGFLSGRQEDILHRIYEERIN